jgi:hypothetical protein
VAPVFLKKKRGREERGERREERGERREERERRESEREREKLLIVLSCPTSDD